MSNMRDTYAVSFVELVDSAWKPKVEAKTFESYVKSKGSLISKGYNIHIRVKTSANQKSSFKQIDVRKFNNKREFINYMTQEAADAWDTYENTKKFEKECNDIVYDVENNKEISGNSDFIALDDTDEYLKEFYQHDPLDLDSASSEDISDRLQEIKGRESSGWEPYAVMREVYGVDLINTPDIATKENLEEARSKRPDPVNNKGLFRRVEIKR